MADDVLTFTILGCGSSPGVPRIHGEWGACDPNEPKNRRLRCSLLVQRTGSEGTTSVVVDTSPDFREQMLQAGVSRLDGVLYTHSHADHVHGIDDLRGYVLHQRQRMPIHADAMTMNRIRHGFDYCFQSPEGSMLYPPILEPHEIRPLEPVTINGEGGPITALPIEQVHGPINSLGFRFFSSREACEEQMASGRFSGGLCYSPDISDIPDQSVPYLKELDYWIVDALQYKPHISHFSVSEALEWVEKLGPGKAILTHMHIPLDYRTLARDLPGHVEPGYDMMVLRTG